MEISQKNKLPLRLVICLFFLWALTSNLLPILIPHFKQAFDLKFFKASLVDWAYWISYFCFAIPSGLLMKRFGYKVTIIVGLLLAALGAFLFPMAANAQSYIFFLIALFIVASGMTFLETAANPYIREFGSPETYAQRLNFAQAFNGLGAVIATNVLSHLILTDDLVKSDIELSSMSTGEKVGYYNAIFDSVKLPYLLIGFILLLFAILFVFTKLPYKETEHKESIFFNPFRFARLRRSMIAQFCYVGAQVCISSFFISYAQHEGVELSTAKFLLGGLLIAFMVGRYVGAFLMKKQDPVFLLMLFSGINILLSLLIVFLGGTVGVLAFFGVEFFMSIMYPTIFSLGIKGMEDKTQMASSYMVMTIIGGALLPMLLGSISDNLHSIQWGYGVPLLCFSAIYIYSRTESKIRNKERTSQSNVLVAVGRT